jgi:hypothetical protein
LANNSGQPESLVDIKQSDSPNKGQLNLSHGVDEEGGVVDEEDEKEPIKLITGPCDSDSGY